MIAPSRRPAGLTSEGTGDLYPASLWETEFWLPPDNQAAHVSSRFIDELAGFRVGNGTLFATVKTIVWEPVVFFPRPRNRPRWTMGLGLIGMPEFSTQQLVDDIARSLSAGEYDEAVRTSLAAFDVLNQETIERKGVKLDCGEGCSVCCTLRVDVFAHEVFLIAHHIRSEFAAEEQTALLARLETHAEKVLPLTAFEHATRNIVCPLLQNDRCSVYAVRSHSCRRHHSQDLAACQYTFDHPEDLEFPGAHDRDLFRALTGRMQLNIDVYGELGFDQTIYELNTALREALLDPDSWERWCAGEQAFLGASVTPAE